MEEDPADAGKRLELTPPWPGGNQVRLRSCRVIVIRPGKQRAVKIADRKDVDRRPPPPADQFVRAAGPLFAGITQFFALLVLITCWPFLPRCLPAQRRWRKLDPSFFVSSALGPVRKLFGGVAPIWAPSSRPPSRCWSAYR